MRATGNQQINSRIYWNHIYTTPAREKEYWDRTYRFFTLMNYIKDGDKFLDMGCGVAVPARIIKEIKIEAEIWGVDISDEIIERNKKEIPEGHWYQGCVGCLKDIPKNYFDMVFAGELIEHLDNPLDLFRDAYKLLKKGGELIISTPKEKHIISPEHIWYLNQDDLENLFFTGGFKNVKFVKLADIEHLVVFFAVGTK